MKLSSKTLSVLKNFNTINQSIVVNPGNVLKTISGGKNIFARAEVDESFPSKFAIHELSKFLGAVSLFTDPTFDFFDDHLKIAEGKNVIRYVYADESLIVRPPDRDIQLPSKEVYFELSEKDLASTIKALSVLQVPEVCVVGDGGTIYVKASSSKNPTSDSFSIAVGVTDADFNMVFKGEYLRFLPASYRVSVSSKGIAEFATDGLSYWVATEQNSKYGV